MDEDNLDSNYSEVVNELLAEINAEAYLNEDEIVIEPDPNDRPLLTKPPLIRQDYGEADAIFQYLCDKHPTQDITRHYIPEHARRPDEHHHFWDINIGKRTITIRLCGALLQLRNIKDYNGKQILIDLCNPNAFDDLDLILYVASILE